MDERDEPVRHETTIINAGRGDGGGGGAALLALVVALLVGIAAFLYFGGYLGGRGDTDINVNIKTPDINLSPPGGGGGNSTQ